MKKQLIVFILACLPFIGYSQSNELPDPEAYFSALIVEDIEKSITWYTANLGFKTLNKVVSEESGFKQANLKRGNILIELIELKTARTLKESISNYNSKTRTIGFFKIGFQVSDFDKWIHHLKKNEVSFHGRVVTDDQSGKKMTIIKDPDGNRIQLFEK